MSWNRRRRYVSVDERRERAAKKIAKMRRAGREVRPVEISGRAIAKTFWGKAWCENLEAYSDYENRLPRGRTYARNGSVVDLQIEAGRIEALVSGSRMYEVELRIAPLPDEQWQAIRGACAGQIDSLVELLQGKLSRGVMEIVTRAGEGLFPSPAEIELSCSCPDWATMCKHVAATLYGVGARLDHEPEMLFRLRGVDPAEMIEEAIDRGVTQRRRGRGRRLQTDDLASIFGVDIDFSDEALPPEARPRRQPRAARNPTTADAARTPPAPGVAADLPEGARRLLTEISEEPGLRTPQLMERLGVSRSAVTSAIAKLRQRGLVTFEGAPRNGGYHPSTDR